MALKRRFPAWPLPVAGALIIRLLSLFFVTPIDFRWESYHYWQIALYTLRVGVRHGRLWDLGGMEYFWGPLPILIQSLLLWILRTTSILPFRILNAVMGSASVYLAYLVGKRHFDEGVGLLSAVLVMVNPLLIFNSVIGMQGTMGVFFVLLALTYFRRSYYLMGFSLALSSLCRVEFWLLTFGVALFLLLFERGTYGTLFLSAMFGWLTPMFPYFIHLGITTGNPIYPFYWNFIGNIAGGWKPWYVSPTIRGVFAAVLAGAASGLFLLYKNRDRVKNYVIYAVFLGFAAYHGLVYAVSGTAPLFERFFLLDVAVGSIILSRIIIYNLPKQKALGAAACLVIGLSTFFAAPYYVGEQSSIEGLYLVADQLGGNYTGGRVLCNMPMINYRLIHNWSLSHKDILGTLYCDYTNMTTALKWLKGENATYLVGAEPKAYHMLAFFSQHPSTHNLFTRFYGFSGASLYTVNRTLIDTILAGE